MKGKLVNDGITYEEFKMLPAEGKLAHISNGVALDFHDYVIEDTELHRHFVEEATAAAPATDKAKEDFVARFAIDEVATDDDSPNSLLIQDIIMFALDCMTQKDWCDLYDDLVAEKRDSGSL